MLCALRLCLTCTLGRPTGVSPSRQVPAFVTDSNRPQPLRPPPPTACPTAPSFPSDASPVPSPHPRDAPDGVAVSHCIIGDQTQLLLSRTYDGVCSIVFRLGLMMCTIHHRWTAYSAVHKQHHFLNNIGHWSCEFLAIYRYWANGERRYKQPQSAPRFRCIGVICSRGRGCLSQRERLLAACPAHYCCTKYSDFRSGFTPPPPYRRGDHWQHSAGISTSSPLSSCMAAELLASTVKTLNHVFLR